MPGWTLAIAIITGLMGCALDRSGLSSPPGLDGALPPRDGNVLVDGSPPDAVTAPDADPPDAGPTDVPLLTTGQLHGCEVRTDGALACWGNGGDFRLGRPGDSADHGAPGFVGSDTDWEAIDAGVSHTCGLRAGGRLFCWGDGANRRSGATADQETPLEVLPGMLFDAVAAGGSHSCAIARDRQVWCWGRNNHGQLGRDTLAGESEMPELVIDVGPRWDRVECGLEHTCAIARDGQLWCWGHNSENQLGLGDMGPTEVGRPTLLDPGAQWRSIATGAQHSCGVKTDGTLWCWGHNDVGQIGTGETGGTTDRPIAIVTGQRFSAVSAHDDHSCAVHADGALWCWGKNGASQLGLGDTLDRTTPTRLDTPTVPRWLAVEAGGLHSCAVDARRLLFCWGDNGDGQLGLGEKDRMDRVVPTPLP